MRARRLERSHLLRQAPGESLVDVVRDVCGVQAQILVAAELALSARVGGLTQADLRDALWVRRSLVRVWTVRGTIHIVPAADLPLWTAALGANRYWESAEWLAKNGLTRTEATRVFDAIALVLDGRTLTRAQVADAVVERVGERIRPKLTSMWGELLAPVTYMGKLCFGPSTGTNVTFVRADQWIGERREIAADDAWRELVHRYLRAYAPAPLEGVARWFGMVPAHARARLTEANAATISVDGQEAWILRDDLIEPRGTGPHVRLIAQYDPYVLGCRPRESIVSETARARIRTFKRGRWEGSTGVPVVLVDGVVSGVWDRRERKGRIEVAVEVGAPLTSAHRPELEREAERVAAFLGGEADLRIVS